MKIIVGNLAYTGRFEKMNKDKYIEMISLLSDQYGNELVNMMEQYNKPNLVEITYEEAKEFYEKLKERLFYV